MTEQTKQEYNSLPEDLRADLGYEWRPTPVSIALNHLANMLERNGARAFMEDVYASNDSVFRNIVIQLPHKNEAFPAENIHIQFGRDKGRQLTLTRT